MGQRSRGKELASLPVFMRGTKRHSELLFAYPGATPPVSSKDTDQERGETGGSGTECLGPEAAPAALPAIRPSRVPVLRYASLYFCCAIEGQDNELITLELIHRYVELLDKYFGSVSLSTHPFLSRQSPLSARLWDPSSLCPVSGKGKLEQ